METGYKCFDKNLQCRGFQYEVGCSYEHDGEIEMCKSGFHFCMRPSDVFNYYDFDIDNRVCIIEFDDENVIHGDDKSVTGKILIVKELSWNDVLDIVNTGKGNTGHRNSGDRNSGNWNSGDRNSGIFCSKTPTMIIFNKQTDISYEDFNNDDEYRNIRQLMFNYDLQLTYWLSFNDMTNDEHEQYRKYECQGGVLLLRDYKTACELWWKSIPEELKREFVEWEHFDAEVFEEITGIKV